MIPTLQKSKYDLVNWGGEIDVEKDLLLEEFFKVAKPLCTKLRERGTSLSHFLMMNTLIAPHLLEHLRTLGGLHRSLFGSSNAYRGL